MSKEFFEKEFLNLVKKIKWFLSRFFPIFLSAFFFGLFIGLVDYAENGFAVFLAIASFVSFFLSLAKSSMNLFEDL